jgi:hypothetical protein
VDRNDGRSSLNNSTHCALSVTSTAEQFQLSPYNRDLQNLIVAQLARKFLVYETLRFIVILTTACHWILLRARHSLHLHTSQFCIAVFLPFTSTSPAWSLCFTRRSRQQFFRNMDTYQNTRHHSQKTQIFIVAAPENLKSPLKIFGLNSLCT